MRGISLSRWMLISCGLLASLFLASCGTPGSGGADRGKSASPMSTVAPPESGGARAAALTNCTRWGRDAASAEAALAAAVPGDRICLAGGVEYERVELTRSGTRDRPISILGGGQAVTSGITVEADNIVVDGVIARQPLAPGVSLKGVNITLRASSVISPQGGDGDGIRFWGRDIRIIGNVVRDTQNLGGAHADAIQTFATDQNNPSSQNVLIDDNRFEDIANMCLIAEGPNSSAGDGSGQGATSGITFSNNYCANHAGQAVYLDNIAGATITGNQIANPIDKAFSLKNLSTGATVRANILAPGSEYEVGIDGSSRAGYQGPEPGGNP